MDKSQTVFINTQPDDEAYKKLALWLCNNYPLTYRFWLSHCATNNIPKTYPYLYSYIKDIRVELIPMIDLITEE